jgi:hypothetical protein
VIEPVYKFAFVLNKKVDTGPVLNAVGHMSAALVGQANDEQKKQMFFVDYQDAGGNRHPVSGLSLIILSAKNANQIRTAREAARSAGILHVDFLGSMTQGTYQEQMARTAQLPEAELDYWGLALFGAVDKVNEITRKFSLYS